MQKNMKKSGIYLITNNINNKKYVGQSVDLNKRLECHFTSLSNGTHRNFHLQKSVNKYGIKVFTFEIIEFVKKENLSDREIYWIRYYDSVKNGYNVLSGGKNEYRERREFLKNEIPPLPLLREVYKMHIEGIDFYCQVVFGISYEELLSKNNKTKKEEAVLKKYLSRKNKLEDLLSGKFEKYKDKRSLNGLIDYEFISRKTKYSRSTVINACANAWLLAHGKEIPENYLYLISHKNRIK